MCVGMPMMVLECDGMSALVERRGQQQRVSMLLLGDVPVGTQVLVFLDSAVRILDPQEAQDIDNALDGLAAALEGRDFDHLFADLINREPQLPEHLREKGASC